MKIKNVSQSTVILSDLLYEDRMGVSLKPGQEITVFDEDAERSKSLASAIEAKIIEVIGREEPSRIEAEIEIDSGEW